MRAAIFLDRDGVINVDRQYVSRVEDFQFIDGAVSALRKLHEARFPLVIVTNQSAIGRGLYSLDDFQTLNRWMLAELARQGVAIAAVYYCPHAPEADCDCRKPAPGMLLRAAAEHDLDLSQSWLIGDKPTDIEAAERAGVPHTIQVLSGQTVAASEAKAVFVCPTLFDTVPIIFRVALGGANVKYATADLNGQTVLITGGAGFIGSNLAFHIEDQYPRARVVVFDAFLMGNFRNLRGFRGECLAGDIASPTDLARLASYRFDTIFHEAAISDTTVTDQARMVRVNTNTLPDLVDLAVKTGAKALVYASSAGVYGNSPAPNRVGHGEEPTNVYGFSKLMMDHAARTAMAGANLRIVGLRYFNVYGPREEFKGTTASMILQLARQMLAGQRPRLFRSGEQRRDFVYIEDVIHANLRAITAPASGVFNVGSGEAREFNELLAILARELGADGGVDYIDNPWSFYQNHTEADIAPTRAALGYEPRFSLEDGIRAYLPEILRLCRPEVELCST